MIRYYIKSSTNTRQEMEQIIDKKCTVRQVSVVRDSNVLVQ